MNVTVDETDETAGRITISWVGAFEIDQALFPPPYKYELFSGDDLDGVLDLIMAIADDTTFQLTEINTSEREFNFLVKLIIHLYPLNPEETTKE